MSYDPEGDRKKEKREHKKRDSRRNALMQSALNHESGRKLVFEIINETGLLAPLSSTDPALTQRQLGRRDIGVILHNWIMEACPERLIDYMNEQKEKLNKEHDNGGTDHNG